MVPRQGGQGVGPFNSRPPRSISRNLQEKDDRTTTSLRECFYFPETTKTLVLGREVTSHQAQGSLAVITSQRPDSR